MYKTLLCIIGSAGFCVLLNTPKSKLIYAITGSAISATVFETMTKSLSVFTSALCASLVIGVFSEIIARCAKTPSSVILIPSTIPLLPGSFLFYAVRYFIEQKYEYFTNYLLDTVYTCFGIAGGIVITAATVITIRNIKNNIFT